MKLLPQVKKAVAAAEAEQIITPMDAATVAALYNVAARIDDRDAKMAQWEKDCQEARENGDSTPPQPWWDNTLLGSYLRYCESLGISPKGRKAFNAASINQPKKAKVEGADEVASMRAKRAQGR